MKQFTITIYPEGKKISASKDDLLLNVLKRAGIPITASCGGQGTCGKCRVIVKKGKCRAFVKAAYRNLTKKYHPDTTQILYEQFNGDWLYT